jgi:hypothetical protein
MGVRRLEAVVGLRCAWWLDVIARQATGDWLYLLLYASRYVGRRC